MISKTPKDRPIDQALTPRRGFLVAASAVAALAVAAYLYEDVILGLSPTGSQTPFAILIVSLVLIALALLLCYRVPRLGNRLLGHDVVLKPDDGRDMNEGYHFTGSFKVDTAADTKRQNSRRKQARATRRQLAQATRQMQAEKQKGGASGTDMSLPNSGAGDKSSEDRDRTA